MVLRKIVVAVLVSVLLREVWWCHACWEDERIALMQLHTAFNISDEFRNLVFPYKDGCSWGKSANCCDWRRVMCNPHTWRVTELHLTYSREWDSRDLYLNASLFLPFTQLTYLDLRFNGIINCLENEGFERLNTLEYLDLSFNNFNNNIIPSLSNLFSLKTLIMIHNKLKGKLYLEDLNKLKNLRELSMDDNEIEELIFFNGGKLRLSNLEKLFLGYNRLNDTVLSSLEGLSSLKMLNLENNQLGGSFNITKMASLKDLEELVLSGNKNIKKFVASKGVRCLEYLCNLMLNNMTTTTLFVKSLEVFPYIKKLALGFNKLTETTVHHGLCNMKHLQWLYLSNNFLSGGFLRCLRNFTSLQHLDLSSNLLVGNLSLFPVTLMTSVQALTLSYNNIQIPTSLVTFYNCSKLRSLCIEGNEFFAEKEPHNLTPKFQLEELYIDGGGYKGFFPRFLYHQYNLQKISLRNNHIRGEFPYWLLENNTRLQSFTLSNTSMFGFIKLPNHSHLNLCELDISMNYFNGQIPTDFGSYFPSIKLLDMSHNELGGSIPPFIGNLTSLCYLYFSNNQLSGAIPMFFGSSQLEEVILSKNMLHGSLTNAFSNSPYLTALDLSHNFLSGNIPEWIGNLSGVWFLQLGHNYFEGEIPRELCQLNQLSIIDLSNNNLSGDIPPCLKSTSISYRIDGVSYFPDFAIEFTTKSISYSYGGIVVSYFSGIDLSSNKLTGQIPPKLGYLRSIQVLNLSHNSLRGPIPSTFSNLEEIESLDLSHNNLEGKIPSQLTQLTSIAVFSVAYNNLSGRTPDMVNQFASFENISYEGNPFLCGKPLSKSCEAVVSPLSLPEPSENSKDDVGFMDMEVFYVSFMVSYVILLLGTVAVLYINPYWRRASFHFVEMKMIDSYYFIVCNFKRLFRFRA